MAVHTVHNTATDAPDYDETITWSEIRPPGGRLFIGKWKNTNSLEEQNNPRNRRHLGLIYQVGEDEEGVDLFDIQNQETRPNTTKLDQHYY